MAEISKDEWRLAHYQKFERKVKDLAEKRYKGNIKDAFQNINRITQYAPEKLGNKGKIVSKIKIN